MIQKLTSTTMALLLLLSTVSWTVDKHLCMGRVMDVAFFSNAEDCGMEAAIQQFDTAEKHCCDNESFVVEGQDDLKPTFNDIDLGQQLFLVAFSKVYLNLFSDFLERPVPENSYPPPLLVQDYTVLYESYLI